MTDPVAITGVGHSRVLRRPDEPLGRLTLDACRAALDDAGLPPERIDGVACAPRQPVSGRADTHDGLDHVTADFVARGLGLRTTWRENVGGSLLGSLVAAVHAVGAGRCEAVLVCRSLHGPRGRYGYTTTKGATGPAQFEAPYGVFVPAVWAQIWQRYRDLYGVGTRAEMAELVVQSRANGLLWEHGYWTSRGAPPLTVDEYLAGRMVSTPLCLHDCDVPVHGAAAFVVGRPDADAPHPPAYVLGLAPPVHADGNVLRPWPLEQEQAGGREVAARLWADSGLGPGDVDVANLYDGFSIIAILWLEAFGFCGPGEGFAFVQDGRTALGGGLPLNTSGGNLGAGRMHGIPHLMDAVLQVTGRAGPRQVRDAATALVALGPQSGGGAVLLGASPHQRSRPN